MTISQRPPLQRRTGPSGRARNAADRTLLDEPAAIAEIEKVFGNVRVIQLSKTPLDEQIDLVSKAPVIISPLGQALAVSLFARNSVIINLDGGNGPDAWGDAFRNVATICGNQAISLYSGSTRTQDGSFTFPPHDLNQMLEKVKKLTQ